MDMDGTWILDPALAHQGEWESSSSFEIPMQLRSSFLERKIASLRAALGGCFVSALLLPKLR